MNIVELGRFPEDTVVEDVITHHVTLGDIKDCLDDNFNAVNDCVYDGDVVGTDNLIPSLKVLETSDICRDIDGFAETVFGRDIENGQCISPNASNEFTLTYQQLNISGIGGYPTRIKITTPLTSRMENLTSSIWADCYWQIILNVKDPVTGNPLLTKDSGKLTAYVTAQYVGGIASKTIPDGCIDYDFNTKQQFEFVFSNEERAILPKNNLVVDVTIKFYGNKGTYFHKGGNWKVTAPHTQYIIKNTEIGENAMQLETLPDGRIPDSVFKEYINNNLEILENGLNSFYPTIDLIEKSHLCGVVDEDILVTESDSEGNHTYNNGDVLLNITTFTVNDIGGYPFEIKLKSYPSGQQFASDYFTCNITVSGVSQDYSFTKNVSRHNCIEGEVILNLNDIRNDLYKGELTFSIKITNSGSAVNYSDGALLYRITVPKTQHII